MTVIIPLIGVTFSIGTTTARNRGMPHPYLFKFKRLFGRFGETVLQRPVTVHGVPVTINLYGVGETWMRWTKAIALEIVIDNVLPVGRRKAGRQFQIVDFGQASSTFAPRPGN